MTAELRVPNTFKLQVASSGRVPPVVLTPRVLSRRGIEHRSVGAALALSRLGRGEYGVLTLNSPSPQSSAIGQRRWRARNSGEGTKHSQEDEAWSGRKAGICSASFTPRCDGRDSVHMLLVCNRAKPGASSAVVPRRSRSPLAIARSPAMASATGGQQSAHK